MELSVGELYEAVGGKLQWADMPPIDGSETAVRAVKTDSRDIAPGDVFWPLPGRRHHGVEFAHDALFRGAIGVVSDRSLTPLPGAFCLQVAETRLALWELAAWYRNHFSGSLVGVNGIADEQTTLEMIRRVLGESRHGTPNRCHFDSHVAVPLSLLCIVPTDDHAVVELHGQAAGEIEALARLCEPDIGVIMNAADVPIRQFGLAEGVALSHGELLSALGDHGCAILNGDDPQLRATAGLANCEKLWFGRTADNDVIATHVESRQGRLRFQVNGLAYSIGIWGRHHLASALAAITVARLFGRAPAETAEALAEFRPVPMDCEVTQVGDVSLINDNRRACPFTMKTALALLREFGTSGRRTVVSGDMRELANAADRLHYQFGQEVVTLGGADRLIACGQYAAEVAQGAINAGMHHEHIDCLSEPSDATVRQHERLPPGDVLLVTGTRSLEMDRVIDALCQPKRMQVA